MFKPILRHSRGGLRWVAAASATTLCAVLSACAAWTTGPVLEKPTLLAPERMAVPGGVGAAPAAGSVQAWWKGFNDPVLDALVDEAVRNSADLALAHARLSEAKWTLGGTESNFYPTVDLNAGATRKRVSETTTTFPAGTNPVSDDRQLGLSASYEIDFWGKFARAEDAARARMLAQEASRGVVLTTLVSAVAQNYLTLRALDAQAQFAQSTLRSREDNLRLQKRRFEAGVVGELDVRQAESEADGVSATVQQIQQNRSNAEAALAVLVGRKPGEIVKPVVARGSDIAALYAAPTLPAQLTSQVLLHRPDIVGAEQALWAAQADLAQARTAYFPKISLTANVGQQSSDMSKLLEPASLFWNLIGNLTQPVFRAGAIGSLVGAANARQEQALAQYVLAVQNAFRDVHDALNNMQSGRALVATNAHRIEALRTTLRLAELRYKSGYSSYLEVLTAQRDLAQAEITLIDVQRNQLLAVVGFHKAVGGGWDMPKALVAGQ